MPATPHSLTSVFTHSDHVFQGLPFSSAGNLKVCDRFDTGRGPLYMAIPSESPTVKDRCYVLDANFVVVKLRVFHLCLQYLRSNRSWHGHCGGVTTARVPLVPTFRYHAWSIAEQSQVFYTSPRILGERCLEFRTAMALSLPHVSHSSDIDGLRLTLITWGRYSLGLRPVAYMSLHVLWTHIIHCEHRIEFFPTPL